MGGWCRWLVVVAAAGAFAWVAGCAHEADEIPATSRSDDPGAADGSVPTGPVVGDHWHAAVGVYVCDDFEPPIPGFDNLEGIHTHGDGVIHVHPFRPDGSGDNATLALFLRDSPVELDDGELVVDGRTYQDGDTCGDERSTVRVARWTDAQAGGEPKIVTEDIADLRVLDAEAYTIAFAPESAEIPPPPSVAILAELSGAATPTTGPVPDGAALPESDGLYPVLAVLPAPCLEDEGVTTGRDGACYALSADGSLGTDAIESAAVEAASGPVPSHVLLALTEAGLEGFNDLASGCFSLRPACPTGQIAIVVDGHVVSAPTVRQPSYERDSIVVFGDFTEEELEQIADALDG